MQFTNRVKTITREDIMPKIVDNLLDDNFITYRYVSGNGAKKFNSYSAKQAIKIAKNTQGGSFSHMDTLDTGTAETRVTMEYLPKGYSKPVAIPGMDQAVNDTEAQIVNLIRAEMESSLMDAFDDIGTMLYGDGTGNGGKDTEGFGNLIDDGTVSANVGGLSRTTYPTLRGTRTNFSGVISMAKLSTLHTAASGGSASRQRPTVWQSSEVEFDLVESLLSPHVRANYDANGGLVVTRGSRGAIKAGENTALGGFTSIIVKGTPWIADEKAPVGSIFLTNENYLSWLGLNYKKLQAISFGSTHDSGYNEAPSKNTGFQWRDFMDSFNQLAEVGHIFLLGNLTTFQPRRHARAVNATGV